MALRPSLIVPAGLDQFLHEQFVGPVIPRPHHQPAAFGAAVEGCCDKLVDVLVFEWIAPRNRVEWPCDW